MNAPASGPLVLQLVATLIPACLALGAVVTSAARPFRAAGVATSLGLGLALITATGGIAMPADQAVLGGLVRLDTVTCVMLVLVSFIAVVIVRFSRTYLDGDPGRARYARALLGTLAAVSLLIVSNNLLVIALAWLGTSLALHQLLTFYRHRPQALVVAHKKFLVSRFADACMLGATALVGTATGSLRLDEVTAWVGDHGTLPASLQLAAVLFVLAVGLKSAQLPFHGWLIQVMEAPTPVSALLHAGVVNIGGFVMIRLAGVMAHAPLAQTLLVVIGMITTVVAALVMTTRVSIKVALAWSTCAQMGFMLVECGLGAWDLALLHLVAHSLYKAHAFLSSGTAVETWRVKELVQPRRPASLARSVGVSVLVLASVVGCVVAAAPSPTVVPLATVLGLSVSPLIVRALDGGARSLLGAIALGAGAGGLYIAGHAVASRLLPVPEPPGMSVAWVILIAGFAVLFAVQTVIEARPAGTLARLIQPWLFAGLYLDETFTRVIFRLSPARRGRPDWAEEAPAVGTPAEASR